MSERRFNETEVASIIERATDAQEGVRQMVSTGSGMTLAQLQEIGRDVGIDPGIIAEAAASVDERPASTTPGVLGLPLRVERVVNLERRLTDDEWERAVVDLRETFGARGVTRGEGSLRQWTNGNLQALLEPTTKGHRIRLRTYKGNALPRLMAGLALVALPGAVIISATMKGSFWSTGPLFVAAAIGVGLIGMTVMGVTQWARRRRDQMESLATRWRSLG